MKKVFGIRAKALNLFHMFSRSNKDVLGLTIIPTMACNFDCIYCYEKDRPDVFMDRKTTNSIINFIKKFEKVDSIHIQWYGGEPLMAFDKIKEITQRIFRIEGVKNKNIVYSSDLVTNAYLLTDDIADSLLDLKINKMQITIDGNEETHNKRRPHVLFKDSYQKILKNIEYLLKQIPDYPIDIRVNVDERNREAFSDVAKELFKRFPHAKQLRIYPGIVQDMESCNKGSECYFDVKKQAEFRMEQFLKHGLNLGFYPVHRTNICLAQHVNSYVIDATGDIHKCWLDIGNKERAIGNINKKGITNEQLLARYLGGCNPFSNSKCMNCSIFPVCGGGCQNSLITNEYDGKQHQTCSVFKSHLKEYLLTHKMSKEKTI